MIPNYAQANLSLRECGRATLQSLILKSPTGIHTSDHPPASLLPIHSANPKQTLCVMFDIVSDLISFSFCFPLCVISFSASPAVLFFHF